MSQQNTNKTNLKPQGADANKDPISGAHGAHPVGVSLGAAGVGAAVGAAGGAVAGPIGAVAGAAVGAVVGGLAGKAAAESINPTTESKYWLDNHGSRPYANSALGFDDYAPAYRYGWESFGRHAGEAKTFDGVEADLGRAWDKVKGSSRLGWDQARLATRDAWDRVAAAAGTPRHDAKAHTPAPVRS